MESLRLTTRSSWEDRFTRPSVRALLGDLEKEHHALVQHAREALSSLPQMREELLWQGVPWRWCFGFHASVGEGRAFAYLIPQPGRPGLAIPMESEIVAELPLKKLAKHIREVLTLAPLVGGVRWCQWSLTSKSQIDDIVNLARLKLPDESPSRA